MFSLYVLFAYIKKVTLISVFLISEIIDRVLMKFSTFSLY
jgi:hypothetical protein